MSTHNLCFEQKYEKYESFVSENFQFLEVKFSIYLNRLVFVMNICFPELSEEFCMDSKTSWNESLCRSHLGLSY